MASPMPFEQASLQIMDKVSTFATLVQRSAMMSVGWWTEQELENAFQWAAYCQEVAKQIQGWQELQVCLEKKMAEMCSRMKPPPPVPLNLTFLQFGMDVLLEALVCNPTLTDSLLLTMRNLMATKYKTNITTEIHKQNAAEAIRAYAKKTEKCLQEVESWLKKSWCDVSESPEAVDEVYMDGTVQALLEALACWLEASGSHKIWFEYRLCLVLERLCSCPLGWTYLVGSLSLDLGKVEQGWREAMRKLQRLTLAWMAFQLNNQGTACGLWRVSPAVMAKSAEQCPPFLGWYLGKLEEVGVHLETECNHLCSQTDQPGALSLSKIHAEFSDLVRRFSQLLKMDTETRNTVILFLSSKTKAKVFNMWTDLTSKVLDHFA